MNERIKNAIWHHFRLLESVDFENDENDENVFNVKNIFEVGMPLKYSKTKGINIAFGKPFAVCCASAEQMADRKPRFMALKDLRRGMLMNYFYAHFADVDFSGKLKFYENVERAHGRDDLKKYGKRLPQLKWEQDIDGKKNTDILKAAFTNAGILKYSTLFESLLKFRPIKTPDDDNWYIPAFGELKQAMRNMPAEFYRHSYHMSSTMYDNVDICMTDGAFLDCTDYAHFIYGTGGAGCRPFFNYCNIQ